MAQESVKRRRYGVVALLVVAAIGAALAVSGLQQAERLGADPDNAEQVAVGRTVYDSACAACHGKSLEGQPNWRTPLADGGYPGPPHDASGHTWHHPDELLFRITKHGGQSTAGEGFKSNMPPFMNVLSDQEIWAVLAYIKSRWPAELRRRQAETNQRASG